MDYLARETAPFAEDFGVKLMAWSLRLPVAFYVPGDLFHCWDRLA